MDILKKNVSVYKTIQLAIKNPISAIGSVFSLAVAIVPQIQNFIINLNWFDVQALILPLWGWGVIFSLVFLGIGFLIYAHKLRTQIENGYREIAELRAKGVNIRNKAQNVFTNETELLSWEEEINEWNDETKKALEKINISIGIWFATVDTVPNTPRVGVKATNEKHLFLFKIHDARLHNLNLLIRNSWKRGEFQAEDS